LLEGKMNIKSKTGEKSLNNPPEYGCQKYVDEKE
jgi:hypothetical protein